MIYRHLIARFSSDSLPESVTVTQRSTLQEYQRKRNVSRSREPPASKRASNKRSRGGRRFVIQKHDASPLHYDLRLEIGNVLVSWAIPKGPSTDPREKRLAVHTEDHPKDYASFEGVIPEGEYGSGTVMIWDRGRYRNLRAHKGPHSRSMDASLKDGLIEVWIDGSKIKGGYALNRIGSGKKPRWLLIKMNDDEADARRNPVSTERQSASSGRTMSQIAAEDKRP